MGPATTPRPSSLFRQIAPLARFSTLWALSFVIPVLTVSCLARASLSVIGIFLTAIATMDALIRVGFLATLCAEIIAVLVMTRFPADQGFPDLGLVAPTLFAVQFYVVFLIVVIPFNALVRKSQSNLAELRAGAFDMLRIATCVLVIVAAVFDSGVDLPARVLGSAFAAGWLAWPAIRRGIMGRDPSPPEQMWAVWERTHFLDAEIARFVGIRAIGILAAVLLYMYVILIFAGVYFFIDRCEPGSRFCSATPHPARFRIALAADPAEACWRNFSLIVPGKEQPCQVPEPPDPFLPYLYFSATTSTTVGYGDVYPVSVRAAWLVIAHHLVSVILLISIAGQLVGFTGRPRAAARWIAAPSARDDWS